MGFWTPVRDTETGPTTVDSFEDQGIAEYSVTGGTFNAVEAAADGLTAPDGAYVLKAPQDASVNQSTMFSTPGSGLNHYPGKGEVISWHGLSDTAGAGMNLFYFGADATTPSTDHYEVRLDHEFGLFILYRESSTIGRQEYARIDVSYAANTWYRAEVIWDDGTLGGADNELSVELVDTSTETTVATAGPFDDDSHASNTGIGWRANGRTGANLFFDYAFAQ